MLRIGTVTPCRTRCRGAAHRFEFGGIEPLEDFFVCYPLTRPSRVCRQVCDTSPDDTELDSVIHSLPQLLFAADITFGRQHRGVAEQKLDLLQLAARFMTHPSATPPQIMRRKLLNPRSPGAFSDDIPDHVLG